MPFTNHLANEKSPYLLQHKNNPVDWYPWSDEVFNKAREDDKLIFLSIGYSTCHWCHVMAHESFEDVEVAELLNNSFINVKVDREERPDIDNTYMNVCQIMIGSGGWPLTIVLTPDKKPVFAATYIPRESQQGRIGMLDLIPRITAIWKDRREEFISASKELAEHVARVQQSTLMIGELDEETVDLAYANFSLSYDRVNGGFSSAPKFPSFHNLQFLLRYYHFSGKTKALEMVEHTIQTILHSGIYDQIGYGIHRYSTDSEWKLPHFEKMLYDQTSLINILVELYQITKKEIYKEFVDKTIEYVIRDLKHSDGAFYSAEDADSEGVEGKFYLWKRDELKTILSVEEFLILESFYNIHELGNFKDESKGEEIGLNIIHAEKSLSQIEGIKNVNNVRKVIDSSREKLFKYREGRIRPFLDDKILTDWNGLMISALAKAGAVFQNSDYINYASVAADFILKFMKKDEKSLYHVYRDGKAKVKGFLDDYAFFINGLIDLYESSYNFKYLEEAIILIDYSLKHFYDNKRGGFYFSSNDHEELLGRRREFYDGAIPSGNSYMVWNLIRINKYTRKDKYEEIIIKTFNSNAEVIKSIPQSSAFMLSAFLIFTNPIYEIIIVGSDKIETTKSLNLLHRKFLPNKILLYIPLDSDLNSLKINFPYVKDYIEGESELIVYICKDYICNRPLKTFNGFDEELNKIGNIKISK